MTRGWRRSTPMVASTPARVSRSRVSGRTWLSHSSMPPGRQSSVEVLEDLDDRHVHLGESARSSSTTSRPGRPAAHARIPSRTDVALAKNSSSSGRTIRRPGTRRVRVESKVHRLQAAARAAQEGHPSLARPPDDARPARPRRRSPAPRAWAPPARRRARSRPARSRPSAAPTADASCRPSSCPAPRRSTIAPRVASGSGSNRGVRNSATSAVAAAAVTSDMGVFAPARSLAADFDSDEPIGNPVNRPAAVLDEPIAISSRSGSMRPPCARANAFAGPIASANATSAMPTAPASSSGSASRPTPGQRGEPQARRQSPPRGRPGRPGQTLEAPDRAQQHHQRRRHPRQAVLQQQHRRRCRRRPPRASGGASPDCGRIARTSCSAVSPCASMPSSLGICLMEMSSARPNTKPRAPIPRRTGRCGPASARPPRWRRGPPGWRGPRSAPRTRRCRSRRSPRSSRPT